MSETLRPDEAERELIDALFDDAALGASADSDGLITRLETDTELRDYLLDHVILGRPGKGSPPHFVSLREQGYFYH